MTDPKRGTHPDSAELQRIADGDAGVSREVVPHVESCAECRAEIDRIQRVTAALSLTSMPPASLSARIESKRASAVRPRVQARRTSRFLLPLGLAAAAALALFVPRAWRNETAGENRTGEGKSAVSREVVLRTVLGEWRQAPIDSVWAAATADPSTRIAIVYHDEAARTLADSVASYLRNGGIDPVRTTVAPVQSPGDSEDRTVSVTVFRTRQ